MNQYVKEFIKRGLMFGGFGPIILAIIFLFISRTDTDFSLTVKDYFWGTVSVYVLAFAQAGASLFNQIEHWPLTKSIFFHFATLYIAYSLCYCFNSWIPFEPKVLILFTIIFITVYFATWITVYLLTKRTGKKLNKQLEQNR